MSLVGQMAKSVKQAAVRLLDWLENSYEGRARDAQTPAFAKKNQKALRVVYTLLFSASLAWVVGHSHQPPLPKSVPRTGDIAENTIVSPLTIEIEPREPDTAEKESLAKRIPPIFDYDESAVELWLQRWRQTFKTIRQEFYSGKLIPATSLLESVAKKTKEITGQELSGPDLLFLHQNRFSLQTEQGFIKIGEFLKGRFLSASDLFSSHYSTGIVFRQINQNYDEFLMRDISRIWSLEQVREVLQHLPAMIKDLPQSITKPMVLMVGRLVPPNLVYNLPLTQKRIQTILESTRQPLVSLREGQPIVRVKERVTEEHTELIKRLKELTSPSATLKRFFLTFLILSFFLGILFYMDFKGKSFWSASFKEATVFVLFTLLTIGVVKTGFVILQSQFSNWAEGYGLEYLIPVSTGGILIHLIMGKQLAYTYSVIISVVIGYILDQHFFFGLWSFTVSAAAIESIQSCKQRTDLFRSGAFAGAVGAVMVAAFSLLNVMGFRNPDWPAILITVFLAFLSGILSIVITSTLIPFAESLLGYTTNLKLLELGNFNHPLLHNLMIKAPGTYHHSVIVGSLAELAADKIQANPLLARVSAYYHDIGKMTKPLYFIENQSPNNNPHDQLQPSISAKILFSHVKNGVRMGKEHRLGKEIVDVIEQHHGTTLTTYFYNKAKKLEHPEHGACEESDFRYPGPKPQSREAGIVMLADACEAATRSIADPTPQKIQAMVHSIIEKRFLDNQFADCELTQKDLTAIEEAFTRTLVSLYHHRIEYPGQKNIIQPLPEDSKLSAAVRRSQGGN